jgi:hypothetical protein
MYKQINCKLQLQVKGEDYLGKVRKGKDNDWKSMLPTFP